MAETDSGAEQLRRFTLFDVIVAVAATGLALTLARTHLLYLWANLRAIPFRGPAGWIGAWAFLQTRTDVTLSLLVLALNSLASLLLASTLAFLIMGLRRPRPRLGRLLLQPGMVAVEILFLGLLAAIGLDLIGDHEHLNTAVFVTTSAGIPLAWTILALRGLWDAEPSWIDRFGRGLGVSWSLILAFHVLFYSLYAS